jgi:excinuclease ABC subunit A
LSKRTIHVKGARTHNLKSISCHFEHGSFTVITGPSGSGKSSLAFDTLYAEGQRRFVESMSTYARQFLERLQKPDVDSITHILPAIALEQKNHIKNARSTVGTATEIYDYLRVLYATIGETFCPTCDVQVQKTSAYEIEAQLKQAPLGTKILILAELNPADFDAQILQQAGLFRFWVNQEILDLSAEPEKAATLPKPLQVVIDRLVLKGDKTPARLVESLRKAIELSSHGVTIVTLHDGSAGIIPVERKILQEFTCPSCYEPYPEPFPNMFSFNNPLGACDSCEGFGRIIGLDLQKVIPNKTLSIKEGAIHPFTMPSTQELFSDLCCEAKKAKVQLDIPYAQLSEREKTFILKGAGEYPGIYGFFEWMESKKYKMHIRVMLAKYRGYYNCPTCDGSRLKPQAHQVKINQMSISALCQIPVTDLLPWLAALQLDPLAEKKTRTLLYEINTRLTYLNQIGLGYLTLERQSRTLSGGESQRINLSSSLGSALTDTLYVLDEPTVGLHARDTERLLYTLKQLQQQGNTIVVVEHDPEMIMGADYIIDIGPESGAQGGSIVYEGPVKNFLKETHSKTVEYILNPPQLLANDTHSAKPSTLLSIQGASGHNLDKLTVTFPSRQLVCVAGVSGSGKSSLLKQCLYANYQQAKGQELSMESLPCEALIGFDQFEDIILIDQTPPGRSARSNPVTYVKAYDEIRKLFSSQALAKQNDITAGDFSFNTVGGRCETCQGLGTVTIDMQFMADVSSVCPDCSGTRFMPHVLAIEYEALSINDVLNLTVSEAIGFFKKEKRVLSKLNPLQDIGLGYIQLGQSTSTLSGGESQRLRLATFITESEVKGKPTLFIFDEPTTGLHLTDIHVLVRALFRLIESGHSVVVIEHNIELLSHAQYLIELGPEGGQYGGKLIFSGTPEALIQAETLDSPTAPYLRKRGYSTRIS